MLIRVQAASDWIQTGLVEAAMYSPDQVISSLRQVSGSWGCCLPLYLGAAIGAPTFPRADIHAYSEKVLTWWRTHTSAFP